MVGKSTGDDFGRVDRRKNVRWAVKTIESGSGRPRLGREAIPELCKCLFTRVETAPYITQRQCTHSVAEGASDSGSMLDRHAQTIDDRVLRAIKVTTDDDDSVVGKLSAMLLEGLNGLEGHFGGLENYKDRKKYY